MIKRKQEKKRDEINWEKKQEKKEDKWINENLIEGWRNEVLSTENKKNSFKIRWEKKCLKFCFNIIGREKENNYAFFSKS